MIYGRKFDFIIVEMVSSRLPVILLMLSLAGCAAAPSAISLVSMNSAQDEAKQNFYAAEDYRLQCNFEKAYQHYRYAAFGGSQEAALWLGKFYYDGIGTQRNYSKSRRVFEMIAWQDDQDQVNEAYLYLADIDFYGKGRPRAVIQGYKWMLIGTRDDPFKRAELKTKMEAEMNDRHIKKANEFAKKWLQWRKRDIAGL